VPRGWVAHVSTWNQPRLPGRFATDHATAFVGRLQHLEDLEAIWSAVRDGSRQVVFIGGEPGIGKTRLAEEVAAAVHGDGAAVLWGTCHPDFEVPYRPFVTGIDRLFEDLEEGGLAGVLAPSARQLLRFTPRVRRHLPDAEQPETTDRESRLVLFDAVHDLLVGLAEQRPVVLVLEDLHWAATPTLQLLAHLVDSTADAPLLVLATHRTTAPDRRDELTYVIADLYRSSGVSRIDLGGLGTDEVADYLVREAGMSRSAALGSAAILRDQTAGNPFFLHELWRDLATRGDVATLRTSGFRAPDTVGDMLDRRLAGLTEAQMRVLHLAAVAGNAFDLSLLLEASDQPQEATLEVVDLGVGFGILRSDGAEGRYRFVHALARQAVLDRMAPSRRVRMHARVAMALERWDASDPDVVAQLAHHFERAQALGYGDQAVAYLVKSAQHAERGLAYEDAAERYARAASIPTDGPSSRETLLLASARSHMLGGDFADARRLYEELARSEDPEVLLHAAIGYEDASWRPGGHGARSLELLEAAFRHQVADLADPLHVRALASLGRAHSFVGDDERAQVQGEQALQAARSLGDATLLAHTLAATLWRGMTPTLAPQLLERSVELSALAHQAGDDDHLGPAAFYRAVFGYMLGQPDQWAAARADQVRAARAGGQPFFRYVAACGEYAWQFTRGDFAAVSRTLAALEELGTGFGPDTAEGSAGIQTFMLQRSTGGLEPVRPLITGTEDFDSVWLPGLLALYNELGMWEHASRALHVLMDDVPQRRLVRSQWAGVLAFMVDAAVALGDEEVAAQLHPYVLEYVGLNLVAGQFVAVFGSADRYLGQLESLLGAPEADDRFEQALQMDRRMGATVHQIETLAGWARHADRLGGEEGARRASRRRAEANALAGRIGYSRSLQRSARCSEATNASTDARPDGLTERELDVLRAIAHGLSNREIGARLFISQNTAANHVRSILMKIDAPNRTTAAMYAAEHDLLEDGDG
jgi:DNA-binding CsgD family transcriptional regulator/tetratricopeptide (TPR) repeat protein